MSWKERENNNKNRGHCVSLLQSTACTATLGPKTDKNDIIDFLNSDGDTKPLEELKKRQLSYTQALTMEGLLTHHELTTALFKHMKGSSSPGIDGFTVNHLRAFWNDLGHITTDAINCSFGSELTTSLRKAVIKLLRKGNKDP